MGAGCRPLPAPRAQHRLPACDAGHTVAPRCELLPIACTRSAHTHTHTHSHARARRFRPQAWALWFDPDTPPTPTDSSPISGIAGTCSTAAGAVVAAIDVFPGAGARNAELQSPGGWPNVTGMAGTYLDNWLGMGGTGEAVVSRGPMHAWGGGGAGPVARGPPPPPPPRSLLRGFPVAIGRVCHPATPLPLYAPPTHPHPQFQWFCPPGELVTGLHAAWEPSPSPPNTNLATGVRVYCENPNTCGGGPVPTPVPAPLPPAAQSPPPAAPPPPPRLAPPYAPRPGWSDWLGRETPQSTMGICPCSSRINVS
jgi:hypothetical protein